MKVLGLKGTQRIIIHSNNDPLFSHILDTKVMKDKTFMFALAFLESCERAFSIILRKMTIKYTVCFIIRNFKLQPNSSLGFLPDRNPPKKTEGFVKESITCLQPVQLKMLHMPKYAKTVLEQLPGIKVEIDLEKNEISFEEDANLILSGYRNLLKQSVSLVLTE